MMNLSLLFSSNILTIFDFNSFVNSFLVFLPLLILLKALSINIFEVSEIVPFRISPIPSDKLSIDSLHNTLLVTPFRIPLPICLEAEKVVFIIPLSLSSPLYCFLIIVSKNSLIRDKKGSSV